MALATSAEINPLIFWNDWQYFVVGGVNSPGAIPIDGISGFDRETDWDVKKGKGTQGATLTLTSYPPAEGSITLVFWLPEHFEQWKAFRPLLKYTPKKTKTASDAFSLFYPSLADLDINSCVTKKISPVRHKGLGKFEVVIDMIEWMPVPKKSVVVSPSGASGNANSKGSTPGSPPDPIADAQQKEIADLMKKAAETPVG